MPEKMIEMTEEDAVFINAYERSTKPWEKALITLEKTPGEVVWRESLALTPRELGDNGEVGIQRFLLVGFTLMASHVKLVLLFSFINSGCLRKPCFVAPRSYQPSSTAMLLQVEPNEKEIIIIEKTRVHLSKLRN